MISLLRGILMPDDSLSPSEKMVLVLFETIAFALGWGGVDRLLAGASLLTVALIFLSSMLVSYAGFKWPFIKRKISIGITSAIERGASNYRLRIGIVFLAVLSVLFPLLLALHSVRSDLDAYVMPRTVTSKQADKLHDFSLHRELSSVTVKVNVTDEEATRYSGQILEALKLAGWNAAWDTGGSGNNDVNTLNNGLCIGERGNNPKTGDPTHNPRHILEQALEAADIEVTCSTGSGGDREYSLFLLVGHRPISTRPKMTWRRRFVQWLSESSPFS
jgi:hypothetical protein